MTISNFSHAYWRQIKEGNRTFESVKEGYKEQVKYLAQTDVMNEVITEEGYLHYIGEKYVLSA